MKNPISLFWKKNKKINKKPLQVLFVRLYLTASVFSNTCIALLPRQIVELKPTDVGSTPSGVSGYFLLGCSIM